MGAGIQTAPGDVVWHANKCTTMLHQCCAFVGPMLGKQISLCKLKLESNSKPIVHNPSSKKKQIKCAPDDVV